MSSSINNSYECEVCDIILEKIRKLGEEYNDSLKLCKFFEDSTNWIVWQHLPFEYVRDQRIILREKIDNYHKANNEFMEHYKRFHPN